MKQIVVSYFLLVLSGSTVIQAEAEVSELADEQD